MGVQRARGGVILHPEGGSPGADLRAPGPSPGSLPSPLEAPFLPCMSKAFTPHEIHSPHPSLSLGAAGQQVSVPRESSGSHLRWDAFGRGTGMCLTKGRNRMCLPGAERGAFPARLTSTCFKLGCKSSIMPSGPRTGERLSKRGLQTYVRCMYTRTGTRAALTGAACLHVPRGGTLRASCQAKQATQRLTLNRDGTQALPAQVCAGVRGRTRARSGSGRRLGHTGCSEGLRDTVGASVHRLTSGASGHGPKITTGLARARRRGARTLGRRGRRSLL